MSDAADIKVGITADDKTAKGAKAAEKRLGQIPKHVSSVTGRAAAADEKRVAGAGRSMVRTLGSVEQASARLLGGRSVTSGLTSRLGALRDVSSSLGTGMGEAAASGGLLEGAVGAVGVAVGATIGVLAAAAYGAFQLANGWAKGAAAIGRAAEVAGVGAKALQEFTAAGERVGVDKGASSGALGGLSQTLNDARYGRNNEALGILARLGVKLRTKQDGTVDVEAMLPELADAASKQNSSGQRTLARILGYGTAGQIILAQGGKQLSGDMADADKNAAVIGDGSIDMAKRVVRKTAMIGQSKDRLASQAGEAVAGAAERNGVYDAFVDGGRYFAGSVDKFTGSVSREFSPGAAKIERAGGALERAAGRIERSVGHSGLRGGTLDLSSKDILDLKKTVATEWDRRSIGQGQGIIDTILNRQASGRWGSTIASVVNAKSQFSDVNGPVAWARGRRSVEQIPQSRIDAKVDALVNAYLAKRSHGARSVVGDNLNYANPYASDRRNLGWINRLDGPVLGSGQSVHRHGTTPDLERYRPGAFGVALPDQQPIPVHVTVEHRNAPPGTRTTVRAGSGGAPAVSRAFEPVHGG